MPLAKPYVVYCIFFDTLFKYKSIFFKKNYISENQIAQSTIHNKFFFLSFFFFF